MLGASGGVLGSSGESVGAGGGVSNMEVVVVGGGGGGVDGSNSGLLFGDEDKGRIIEDGGDRSSGGGNRWPRQETIALLKIRSDMDVVFRDSSLKGPLWEDVSRKMADLGYHRSSKKCKEKFENVYKYHKRTKDGRSTKQDGKTYRFFDQLEALENHPPSLSLPQALPPPPPPPPQPSQPSQAPPPVVMVATTMPMNLSHAPPPPHHVTVTSTTNPIISNVQPPQPSSIPNTHTNLISNSTSSSTSSDEEFQEGRIGRKRKWKDFFERLMKEVINKQEELQKKFLDAIEKREHDRTVREEAWRMQEMARMNREHEVLVQERSVAAAKDAAVIAFLQKISDQQPPSQQTQHTQTQQNPVVQQPPPPPPPQQQQQQLSIDYNSPVATHQQSQPQSKVTQKQPKPTATTTPPPPPLSLPPPSSSSTKLDNGGDSIFVSPGASSSRWPKTEVQALINLRTTLDMKYQENGPKGPLWEDISAGMRKLGYNRNAKRCKEKWENINKYFKKVKESNKRRPEDSKTCPYFHLLDAIYKERSKADLSSSSSFSQTPMVPLMVQPEQQWAPIQQDHQQQQQQQQQQRQNQQQQETVMDDVDDEEEDEDDGDEDDDDDEEEEGGGGYEIVSNKLPAKTVGNVE